MILGKALDVTLRDKRKNNGKLLCFKEHHQESEKQLRKRIGENICKLYTVDPHYYWIPYL